MAFARPFLASNCPRYWAPSQEWHDFDVPKNWAKMGQDLGGNLFAKERSSCEYFGPTRVDITFASKGFATTRNVFPWAVFSRNLITLMNFMQKRRSWNGSRKSIWTWFFSLLPNPQYYCTVGKVLSKAKLPWFKLYGNRCRESLELLSGLCFDVLYMLDDEQGLVWQMARAFLPYMKIIDFFTHPCKANLWPSS